MDEVVKNAEDEQTHEATVAGCCDILTELHLPQYPCQLLSAAIKGI